MATDPSITWWLKVAAHAVFAAFAGAMGYLMRAMDGGHRAKKRAVLINCLAAGFVGILVMFICQELGVSQKWTLVTTGVFGWLGAGASIKLIEGMVFRKLGITKSSSSQGESKDAGTSGSAE